MSISKAQALGYGVVEVFSLKVSLTANQIQNAATTPIDIGLPASGAGYYYRVTQLDAKLIYGTAPFVSTYLGIGDATSGNSQFTWDVLLTTVNSEFATSTKTTNLTTNLVENSTISIWTDIDSVGDGDSTIDCYITVEKVAL